MVELNQALRNIAKVINEDLRSILDEMTQAIYRLHRVEGKSIVSKVISEPEYIPQNRRKTLRREPRPSFIYHNNYNVSHIRRMRR